MTEKTGTGKSTGTTALPNRLFDVLLPTLSDSELRVLLVVARSTLGWKQGRGRKERDWLSHAQLCKRTGRSNTPVSRAVDSLVKRGLLLVQNQAGEPQITASQRRSARTNLFFRLSTALLDSPPIPRQETLEYKGHLSTETHEVTAQPVTIPQSGFHIRETTKETGTKKTKNDLSFPQSRISPQQNGITEVEPPQETQESESRKVEKQMGRILQAFTRAYGIARPGEPIPPPDDEAVLILLRSYMERGYGHTLEKWLPAFFASSFGFVRRRNYSFSAYLDCFFVLQSKGHPPY